MNPPEQLPTDNREYAWVPHIRKVWDFVYGKIIPRIKEVERRVDDLEKVDK